MSKKKKSSTKANKAKVALARIFMPAMRLKLKRKHIPIPKGKTKDIVTVGTLFHDHVILNKPYTGHFEVNHADDVIGMIIDAIIAFFKKIGDLITKASKKKKASGNNSPVDAADLVKEGLEATDATDASDMHKLNEHGAKKAKSPLGKLSALSPVEMGIGFLFIAGIGYLVMKK